VIGFQTCALPICHWRNGQPLYDITAHVVFEPGQQRRDVSVRDGAAVVAVPADARRVVTWFENTSASGCQTWDSNLGANYVFEPLAPPAWLGEAQTLISRSASAPCDGAIPATQGFAFDTWARQRATFTSVCFQAYQPGLTDHDAPDLWQQLDARLHWRLVGVAGTTPWRATAVPLAGRTGNNARFALSLRELDPYRLYHCPEVAGTPTPDGSYARIGVEYYVTVNGGRRRARGGVHRGVPRLPDRRDGNGDLRAVTVARRRSSRSPARSSTTSARHDRASRAAP